MDTSKHWKSRKLECLKFEESVFVIEAYKRFMGIGEFPEFNIEYFDLDLEQDEVITARARYDEETGKYILILPSECAECGVPTYLLYHELTHIYDMSKRKIGEKDYGFYLSGYLEYHASQVELMVLMGANKINDSLSFSMSDSANYLNWTVLKYLENKLTIANDLIANESQEKRICGLDVFYNFLGLKSVCTMYATDFVDKFNYRRIADRLPSFLLFQTKKSMTGWIDNFETAATLYSNAVEAICSSV